MNISVSTVLHKEMCFLCFVEKSEPFPWRLPAPAPAGPGTSQQEIFGNAKKLHDFSKTWKNTHKNREAVKNNFLFSNLQGSSEDLQRTCCPGQMHILSTNSRTKSAILCNIKDQIKSMQHQTCTIRTPKLVRSMHDFQDFSKSLLYPCLSEIWSFCPCHGN